VGFDLQKKTILGLIVVAVVVLFALRTLDAPEPDSAPEASEAPESPEVSRPQDSPPPSTVPTSPGEAEEIAYESKPATAGGDDRSSSSAEKHAVSGETEDPSDDDDVEPMPRTIWSPDRDGIRGAIQENIHELKSCYQAWLRLDPTIEGKIVIEFAIQTADPDDPDAPKAEDGTALAQVEELGLASTVEHAFMEGCVSNVFADLWFSPPDDGRMEVTYPLVFSSEE
jgi:hypothetical protein